MHHIRVAIEAPDGITRAGLTSYFESRGKPVVTDAQRQQADVVVMATNRMDVATTTALRHVTMTIGAPVVLLIGEMDLSDLEAAAACNVATVLPRSAITDDRIIQHVQKVVSDNCPPRAEVFRRLVEQVELLRHDAFTTGDASTPRLSSREADVLSLLADGFRTDEIASKLCYSERTVKHVIYTITSRFQLRNRSHLVAYALRTGMLQTFPTHGREVPIEITPQLSAQARGVQTDARAA